MCYPIAHLSAIEMDTLDRRYQCDSHYQGDTSRRFYMSRCSHQRGLSSPHYQENTDTNARWCENREYSTRNRHWWCTKRHKRTRILLVCRCSCLSRLSLHFAVCRLLLPSFFSPSPSFNFRFLEFAARGCPTGRARRAGQISTRKSILGQRTRHPVVRTRSSPLSQNLCPIKCQRFVINKRNTKITCPSIKGPSAS